MKIGDKIWFYRDGERTLGEIINLWTRKPLVWLVQVSGFRTFLVPDCLANEDE